MPVGFPCDTKMIHHRYCNPEATQLCGEQNQAGACSHPPPIPAPYMEMRQNAEATQHSEAYKIWPMM